MKTISIAVFILGCSWNVSAQDWGRYQNVGSYVQVPTSSEMQIVRIPQVFQKPPGSTYNKTPPTAPKPGEPGFIFPMPPGVGQNPRK